MTILSIKNLSKTYKSHQVLKNIDLQINSPGIWALVGPNGSGKTTFLNTITNLLPATSGKIELVDKPNTDSDVFKEVSFLQDNTVLFDYLNGYDHLKYICDVQGINKKRINEVAKYVGMEHYIKKRVGNYSLGMKQHLLLAMAIINKPKLLLLDEPLNGLDPTSAILVRKILIELSESGTTILLSSHNLAEIDRVTSQILFLKNGELIEENMQSYETTYYYFEVNDKFHALRMLEELHYTVEQFENGLKVNLGNYQLQRLLDELKAAEITILDMYKEVAGSEKRYEELFEV
ncbi:ABC transporter ATP-binding protein [Rummeliibacillus sp. NPDC094406]|uniref:ABC transporter ATP-binding protein n=1 Tax=Rummeliibacillus sp. NPDC094406 TaxID=3364511 RepID=UPI0037FF9680